MIPYPDGGTDKSESETDDKENSRPEFARVERERAILTKADRKYLLGEKELSEDAERNARYRIRQRVINGMLDIEFLSFFLREEDQTQIFENNGARHSVSPYLDFVYSGLQLASESPEEGIAEFDEELRRAIVSVERNKNGKLAEVTFNVERREPDPDELFQKVISGDASMVELNTFMDVGDTSRLAKVLREGREIELTMGDTTFDATSLLRDVLPYEFDEQDDSEDEEQ